MEEVLSLKLYGDIEDKVIISLLYDLPRAYILGVEPSSRSFYSKALLINVYQVSYSEVNISTLPVSLSLYPGLCGLYVRFG